VINQLLIDTILQHLRGIDGVNVFEWLSRPLEDDECPAIILRDPSDNVDDGNTGTIENHTLKIEIDIVVSPDNYDGAKMRILIPLVKVAMRDALTSDDESYYIGRYKGRKTIGEHRDYLYLASRLTFEVDYETGKWEE